MHETDGNARLLPDTLPADPEALRIFALEIIAERDGGLFVCRGQASAAAQPAVNASNTCRDACLITASKKLRRRFVKIVRDGVAPTATESLSRIGQIYTVERSLRGRSAEERRAGRQLHSLPLVTTLKTWFEDRLKILSGKSLTAEAIRRASACRSRATIAFALNHWDGLIRFLDDGRIELDTNAVERAMRAIALNRKNSLFAGCDEGAVAWARQSLR